MENVITELLLFNLFEYNFEPNVMNIRNTWERKIKMWILVWIPLYNFYHD